MVDDRVQRAYNWSYKEVIRVIGFLKALEGTFDDRPRARPSGIEEIESQALRQFGALADQFQRICRLEGVECLEQVSRRVREAASPWSAGVARFQAQDWEGARQAFRRAREEFEAVKQTLDRESPMRYHHWLLNPRRHYPKPLD